MKDRNGELKKINEDIMELTDLYDELFKNVASLGTIIRIIKSITNTTDPTVHILCWLCQ